MIFLRTFSVAIAFSMVFSASAFAGSNSHYKMRLIKAIKAASVISEPSSVSSVMASTDAATEEETDGSAKKKADETNTAEMAATETTAAAPNQTAVEVTPEEEKKAGWSNLSFLNILELNRGLSNGEEGDDATYGAYGMWDLIRLKYKFDDMFSLYAQQVISLDYETNGEEGSPSISFADIRLQGDIKNLWKHEKTGIGLSSHVRLDIGTSTKSRNSGQMSRLQVAGVLSTSIEKFSFSYMLRPGVYFQTFQNAPYNDEGERGNPNSMWSLANTFEVGYQLTDKLSLTQAFGYYNSGKYRDEVAETSGKLSHGLEFASSLGYSAFNNMSFSLGIYNFGDATSEDYMPYRLADTSVTFETIIFF